jgi:putative acetyltransferase
MIKLQTKNKTMISLARTNSDNQDFIDLVKNLDMELAKRDGDDHSFYSQFNKIDKIKYVVLAYENEIPVGCGAIKEFENKAMEVKRMYVLAGSRGKGVAAKILIALEDWTKELSYTKCVLETGKRQPEAIQLYEKSGYKRISNYGQYIGIENSVCFEKKIK